MPPSPSSSLQISVLGETAEAVALWRELLVMAPAPVYQTPEFVLSWRDMVDDGEMLWLAVQDDRPRMLLPLTVAKRGPLAVASFPAGKHSNFNLPLFDPSAKSALGREVPRLLVEAGRAAGIDCFALRNQPLEWSGVANPLAALRSRPSPSFGSSLQLEADADRLLARIASKDRRKKLRQKLKWLQALGGVEFFEAASEGESSAVLDAYFQQKSFQFEHHGIDDPFAGPAVRSWLKTLSASSLQQSAGTLRLFGLRIDGAIIAVWGVGVHKGCASAMVTSHAAEAQIARCSPGELLLEWTIRRLCSEGCKQLDYGVGEARYKSQWSDTTVPLFDAYLPVTPLGRAAASAMQTGAFIKRCIKQSERLSSAMKVLRRLKP